MNDDTIIGNSLEDDAQAPVFTAPETPPAEHGGPAPVAAAPQEETGGSVPVSALHAERQRRQELEQRIAALEPMANRVRELEPYAALVQANPALFQRQAPVEPVADPEVEQFAQDFDLYTTDDSGRVVPDMGKAQRIMGTLDRRAGRLVERSVAPLHQQTQHERAQVNVSRLVNTTLPNGVRVSPQAIQAVRQQLGAEQADALFADDNASVLMGALAYGLEQMARPAGAPVVAPPLNAPLVTESAGGGQRSAPQMSRLEEGVVRERGVTGTKWQELTRGFQAGRAMSVED